MTALWALARLASALLLTTLTWPWRRRRALPAFRENYAPEGLLPVLPEVHSALARAGTCIACGRCDRIPTGGRVALSQLVRAWSRSLPDAPLAAAEFSRYSAEELRQAEIWCPTGVPIAGLAQRSLVQAQAMAAALAPRPR